MKRLISYFLRGVVFVAPIGITAWLLASAFLWVDDWVRSRFELPFPGLGLGAAIVAVTFVGFLASNFLTRRLMRALEGLVARLPLVKILHGSFKDLLSAFVGDERRFDKPVLVSMNRDGTVKLMGFITRETLETYGLEDHLAVYFPQAYNFAGQVVVVPKTSITPLDRASSDVMTFIVSGGISGH